MTTTERKDAVLFGTAKDLIGDHLYARLAVLIRPILRFAGWLPFMTVRILCLRLAGAKIGRDLGLAPGVYILNPWRLVIGAHNNIARGTQLDARGGLTIGDNVNISEQVAIWSVEHHVQSATFAGNNEPVVIGNRAWLGFRSIILPGVEIGEGAVVASGAVVTKNVLPFTIVGGVPARVIGQRSKDLTYTLGRSVGAF